MQTATSIPPRRRPVGVTIIAVLTALQGSALLIISGIGFVGFLATISTARPPLSNAIVAGLIGSLLPFAAVLLLLVAWGLWTLKRWAFWGAVVAQFLSLVGSINMLAQTGDTVSTATTSNIILAVVIVIYLFADRNVRAAFRL